LVSALSVTACAAVVRATGGACIRTTVCDGFAVNGGAEDRHDLRHFIPATFLAGVRGIAVQMFQKFGDVSTVTAFIFIDWHVSLPVT